jgi:hypothetical protein
MIARSTSTHGARSRGCSTTRRRWGWLDMQARGLPVWHLAVQLCHWATGPSPDDVLDALCRLSLRARGVGEALLHVAFGRRGRPVPTGPVVLSALDDGQRRAIAAFSGPLLSQEHALLHRLGFVYETDAADLVAEHGTYFQTFVAPEGASGGAPRWHLGHLWFEALARRTLSFARAAEILEAAITPTARVEEIASTRRRVRVQRLPLTDAQRDGDVPLCVTVVQRLLGGASREAVRACIAQMQTAPPSSPPRFHPEVVAAIAREAVGAAERSS